MSQSTRAGEDKSGIPPGDCYTVNSLRTDLRSTINRTVRELHASLTTVETDEEGVRVQHVMSRLIAVAQAADAELALLAEEENARRESTPARPAGNGRASKAR